MPTIRSMRRLLPVLGCTVAGWGCAETTPPLPPAEEVLVVVNSTAASLTVFPTGNGSAPFSIPLGGTAPTPVTAAARDEIVIVPMGLDDGVTIVDLKAQQVINSIGLPTGSGATGAAIVNDSIAYVANPNLNTVTRINVLTGDTASVRVGVYPQGMVFTRGRLFVLNGNLVNFTPVGPSWITVIDPVTNARASGIDSIPLPGPGNAGFADVASDGLIYVMSAGNVGSGEGRLHIVDPVDRVEVANFGGFGTFPGVVAADGGERLFISSFSEGLMEFNTVTRTVVRGAGNGVNVPSNAAVEIDGSGRIFAVEAGPCQGGQAGVAHVLRRNLTESDSVTLGECSVYAVATSIPPS